MPGQQVERDGDRDPLGATFAPQSGAFDTRESSIANAAEQQAAESEAGLLEASDFSPRSGARPVQETIGDFTVHRRYAQGPNPEVESIVLVLNGPEQTEAGRIAFAVTGTVQADALVEMLRQPCPPFEAELGAKDPESLSWASSLRQLLKAAEETGAARQTACGRNIAEIMATVLDNYTAGWGKESFAAEIQSFQLAPGVLWLNFPNRYMAMSSCLRLVEIYDGPEQFRRPGWTLSEYKAACESPFDFYDSVSAVSLPKCKLTPFLEGGFPDLSPREDAVLDHIRSLPADSSLICTFGTPPVRYILHELFHRACELEPDFKAQVMRLGQEFAEGAEGERMRELLEWVRYIGYTEDRAVEEVLANLVEGPGAIPGMNETDIDTWKNMESGPEHPAPQLAEGRYDALMARAAEAFVHRFPQIEPLLRHRDELACPRSITMHT